MNISIIGGGRWARVIAGALAGLPGRVDQITLHSPTGQAAASAWITKAGLGDRLRASPSLPDYNSLARPDAAIIANRASDHFHVAQLALEAGVPTMVEKPLATTQRDVEELGSAAQRNGTLLAASQVFLFARYMNTFARCIAERGGVASRMNLAWADTRGETRHGEVKSYDTLLPITDDIVPHVVPILARLGVTRLAVEGIDVRRGGAEVQLRLAALNVTVTISLARDAERRERRLEVETASGMAILDFSPEPGTIIISNLTVNGDPDWDTQPRPLATMLSAFLQAAEGGVVDPRLHWHGASESLRLADALRRPYLDGQLLWLKQQVGTHLSSEIGYALGAYGIPNGAQPAFWAGIGDQASLARALPWKF